MVVQIELNENILGYLEELAKEHQITPSEVIEALLIGFSLERLTKDLKTPKNEEK